MNLNTPLQSWPGLNLLLRDYCAGAPRVLGWFDHNPHDPATSSRRLAELAGMGTPAEGQIPRAAAIVEQQRQWGAGELACAAAESLAAPETAVVVTGQQVGLFGGPLFTVFKAITTIKLARRLTREHPERCFVPVFWMAGNDSDYDEVRRTWLLDSYGAVQELALAPVDGGEGQMVSHRDVRVGLDSLLAGLEDVLPGGLFRDDAAELLRSAYGSGGLMEGFARLMAALFRDTELVIINPQDPVLMQVARPLIRAELAGAVESEQVVLERNAGIAGAGYDLQVGHLAGDTTLFLVTGGGVRERIARDDGGGFILRRSGRRLSLTELEALADDSPEQFVTDVALRGVYEDLLFPVAAFVGGAAEIAYRAQFVPLWHRQGRRMAPAYLRAMATLLPTPALEVLAEHGLALADCYFPLEELERRIAAASRTEALDQALAGYRTAITSADAELARHAIELDAGLEQTFATLQGNLLRHVDKLEKKIAAAIKRRDEVALSRVRRLHAQVYPLQTPQERVLGILSFLPKQGPGLISTLLDAIEAPSWEHRVIELEQS